MSRTFHIWTFDEWKIFAGVLATIGLYSVLYKETKIYRFFEHMFLGLAAGFTIVTIWTEVLEKKWWDKMMGTVTATGQPESAGMWMLAILLPIGLMGYFVFNKKHNWMSRIPIGMLLGFGSGQVIQTWWNQWGPQIKSSMVPIIPTVTDRFTRPVLSTIKDPAELQRVAGNIYPSQALNNLIFLVTIVCALAYFFFSFEVKNKFVKGANTMGRWLLMVGFGAIFGSTVMARFALVIDRMSFIWIEFFRDIVLHVPK